MLLLGKNIHSSGDDVDFESNSWYFIFLVSPPVEAQKTIAIFSLAGKGEVWGLAPPLCSWVGTGTVSSTADSKFLFPPYIWRQGKAYGLFVWNLLGKVPWDLAVHCCCWLYDARLFWSQSRLKPLDGFAQFSWSFIIYNEWKQTWRINLQYLSSKACCLLHWNNSEPKELFSLPCSEIMERCYFYFILFKL